MSNSCERGSRRRRPRNRLRLRLSYGGAFAAALLAASGCGGQKGATDAPANAPRQETQVRFTDTAAEAGIDFELGHGGRTPLSVLETAPGGCGWADWDGDGRSDVVLVGPGKVRLYRNSGAGRFSEATQHSGISQPGEWMGCAIGDYDGDSDPDLFLTGYRCCALYRNEGRLRFTEVAAAAGISDDLWTTSAAFADIDGDEKLDLYVCGYLAYHKGRQDLCRTGAIQSACGPEHYGPEIGRLYRNLGNGRFRDVSRELGLAEATGKTWSALFSDVNGDGRPDLYLANDQEPCDLFLNEGKHFRNTAVAAGVAYDAAGQVMGAMGLESGDLDGNGRPDLLVTTFYQQARGLFLNAGRGHFRAAAEEWGLDSQARPFVGFGCCLLDADCDGDLDLLIANGHVRDNIQAFDSGQEYRQSLQFFENRNSVFVDVSRSAGASFTAPMVGRGLAPADYDSDGDMDVLVVDLEGRARLLRNDTPTDSRSWLTVSLEAPEGNREGIGAIVELQTDMGRQVREVYRARSVLSSFDRLVHFGLGESRPRELRVRWPDGLAQRVPVFESGKRITVDRKSK